MKSKVESSTNELNLATCPPEVLALETNAETLWRVLLRKVGITVKGGEHIEDRRAWVLRNFGVRLPGVYQAIENLSWYQ